MNITVRPWHVHLKHLVRNFPIKDVMTVYIDIIFNSTKGDTGYSLLTALPTGNLPSSGKGY